MLILQKRLNERANIILIFLCDVSKKLTFVIFISKIPKAD